MHFLTLALTSLAAVAVAAPMPQDDGGEGDASIMAAPLWYTIRPQDNLEVCADVPYGNNTAGNPIQLYQCNGNYQQRFKLDNSGEFELWPFGAVACMKSTGGNAPHHDSEAVVAGPCSTTNPQRWVRNGNRLETGGFCLDRPWGHTADRTKLWLWTCGSMNPNQMWTLVPEYRP